MDKKSIHPSLKTTNNLVYRYNYTVFGEPGKGMTRALGLIIVLVVGLAFLIAFVIKMLLSPKRVEALGILIKQGKTQVAINSARRLIA
jgi:hypothetical protein